MSHLRFKPKWPIFATLLAAAISAAFFLTSVRSPKNGHKSKEWAYTVMMDQFRSTFPHEHIELSILSAHLKDDGSSAQVSYRVRIDDQRDPTHPALNTVEAVAHLIQSEKQWRIADISNLSQSLEFYIPE